MPDIRTIRQFTRRVKPFFVVLDGSEKMAREKASPVGEAMRETVNILRKASKDNPDFEFKIGVLKFSSNAEWITRNGLVPLDDYYWEGLQGEGPANIGAALQELARKLSKNEFLNIPAGCAIPVIIFISSSPPADDWESALSKTNANNKWFKAATKIALGIDGADTLVLEKIVGNREAVIRYDEIDLLKRIIMPPLAGVIADYDEDESCETTADGSFLDCDDDVWGSDNDWF